jgi:multidrug efflux pump
VSELQQKDAQEISAQQSSEKAHFNLSEWALKNQVLVLYIMLMVTITGFLAYTKLGQSEDPPFTFKVMLVRTTWPGASAIEVEQQITDKLEKKIQEVPNIDYSSSYSRPGESMIFIVIKDDTFSDAIPDIWYQVRKKVGDIRHTLPQNVESLVFNDEFSDVYGSMYALTGDGFDNFALKKQAEIIRAELLKTPDVAKVDFFGEQKQRIFIELSNAKLSTLGISTTTLVGILQAQNAVVRGGTYDSPTERIRIDVSGRYNLLQDLRELRLRANNQDFKLSDVARVYRGYEDPPRDTVRFNGNETLLLGVSMKSGGDVIALGHALDAKIANIQQSLPIGLSL